MRSIWYNYSPSNKANSFKLMRDGIMPDFITNCFKQLKSIFTIMDHDVSFIKEKQEIDNYRTWINKLPSQQRLKVGLLQDNDGHSQIEKFERVGMMNEDLEFQFIPMSLEEPFEDFGKVDIIL